MNIVMMCLRAWNCEPLFPLIPCLVTRLLYVVRWYRSYKYVLVLGADGNDYVTVLLDWVLNGGTIDGKDKV